MIRVWNFFSKISKKLYEKYRINHFGSQNISKANIAERGIKTLKSRLFKAMQARNSRTWYDLLEKVTNAYNASFHSSIKMCPNDVTKENEVNVWMSLFESHPKHTSSQHSQSKLRSPDTEYKCKIGDAVRLSFAKYVFQREYHQKWTSEVFFISNRYSKQNIHLYEVKDFNNIEIKGSFQNEEIQKVNISDNTEYRIEAILDEKQMNKQKYFLVKWENYTNDFNSWVLASEINENLNKLVE